MKTLVWCRCFRGSLPENLACLAIETEHFEAVLDLWASGCAGSSLSAALTFTNLPLNSAAGAMVAGFGWGIFFTAVLQSTSKISE